MEVKFKDFVISDDKNKLQVDTVCKLLNNAYWAENRSRDIIEKSITNSICFGIYENNKQVGFARCVTDYATVYWLADVIIDDNYRKIGLGKALMESIISHEDLKGCFGILATRDAHGLYEKYGFKVANDKYMRKNVS
jgi:GNAT superfamily N-acetyltransferase